MSSEDGDVYIMQDEDEEGEWVSPVPARRAIVEAIEGESDLDAADVALDDYVDWDDVRTILAGDGGDAVTFDVDDLSVTVSANGDIDIE